MANKQLLKASLSLFLLVGLIFSPVFAIYSQTAPQNYDYSVVPKTFVFTRDLGFGDRDPVGQNDVKYLQCVLGIIPPSGYFGDLTRSTLKQFQKDHFEEVLAPAGLTQDQATGFFGSSTRNYVNAQIAVEGSTTGSPCDSSSVPTGNFPVGCTSTLGYSTVTGLRCDGSMTTPNQPSNLPAGCSSTNGFSTQTGMNCNSGTSASNQQPGLMSLLPLLPFLLARQGGGTSLGTTPQQNSSTANQNPTSSQDPFSQGARTVSQNPPTENYTAGPNTSSNSQSSLYSANNLPQGCTSTSGFSVTTGESCNQVLPNPFNSSLDLPPGCTNTQGYSDIIGLKCDGTRVKSPNDPSSNPDPTLAANGFAGTTAYNSKYDPISPIGKPIKCEYPPKSGTLAFLYQNRDELNRSSTGAATLPAFFLITSQTAENFSGTVVPKGGTCAIGHIIPISSSEATNACQQWNNISLQWEPIPAAQLTYIKPIAKVTSIYAMPQSSDANGQTCKLDQLMQHF